MLTVRLAGAVNWMSEAIWQPTGSYAVVSRTRMRKAEGIAPVR